MSVSSIAPGRDLDALVVAPDSLASRDERAATPHALCVER
jgi:hypothetical protein